MNKMANKTSHSIIIKLSAAVALASVTISDGGNMRQCHVSAAKKKNAIVPQCNWHYAATGVIVVHYLSF